MLTDRNPWATGNVSAKCLRTPVHKNRVSWKFGALQHSLQLLWPYFQSIAIAPVKTTILCTQDTKIFCYVPWIGTCIHLVYSITTCVNMGTCLHDIFHTSAQLHRPGYIVKWSSASHDCHMHVTCPSHAGQHAWMLPSDACCWWDTPPPPPPPPPPPIGRVFRI